jgi:Zn-dependent M28 family amino/carboxypeptidase
MDKSITKVSMKQLYDYIMELEGPRHPINNLDKLNKAADYILSTFKDIGLSVHEHKFNIEGFDKPFRNIEGYMGDGSQPELIIISHYDTVANCPGADDNASAVALMLECARILYPKHKDYNVRFLSFSLEEGDPGIELKCNQKAQELGMKNERNRYTSVDIHEFMKNYETLFRSFRSNGNKYTTSHQQTLKEIKLDIPAVVQDYFEFWEQLYKELDQKGLNYYTVGSEQWLRETLKNDRDIKGILCLDTIAYTNHKLDSQWFPESMSPRILKSIFKTHKVDFDKMIGDFIAVIASKDSDEIFEAFMKSASNKAIDLPYAAAHFKIDYESLANTFPDLLRSDHGPFWRRNIPGLFLSDTANFRYPFYHTRADIIEKLDFHFLKQVTQATIATIIELNT